MKCKDETEEQNRKPGSAPLTGEIVGAAKRASVVAVENEKCVWPQPGVLERVNDHINGHMNDHDRRSPREELWAAAPE